MWTEWECERSLTEGVRRADREQFMRHQIVREIRRAHDDEHPGVFRFCSSAFCRAVTEAA